jgi:hypothetical protein
MSYYKLKLVNTKKKQDHVRKVKNFELMLSAFFAEHNAAFLIVDHLTEILKSGVPDSQIIADMQLKRTKCTNIVKNVLGTHATNCLVNELKEVRKIKYLIDINSIHCFQTHYSILVDESTDIATKKLVCLLVRYQKPNGTVVTSLLELIHFDARDGSAQMLYDSFKATLEKHQLNLNNLLGLACDGASVMVGKNNSFYTYLLKDVPHLVLLKCICHSAAIIASKACSVLPSELEELMRGIYTYISSSSKRCAQLVEIQDYFNMKHYKVLKLSGTRWLSVHQCVVRTLTNWDALKNFFTIAVFEDNLTSATTILQLLNDCKVKSYLYFLKYALDYINSFNALYQSSKILIQF